MFEPYPRDGRHLRSSHEVFNFVKNNINEGVKGAKKLKKEAKKAATKSFDELDKVVNDGLDNVEKAVKEGLDDVN